MTTNAFRRATLLPLILLAVGCFSFVLRSSWDRASQEKTESAAESPEISDRGEPVVLAEQRDGGIAASGLSQADASLSAADSELTIPRLESPQIDSSDAGDWSAASLVTAEGGRLNAGEALDTDLTSEVSRAASSATPAWDDASAILNAAQANPTGAEPAVGSPLDLELEQLRVEVRGRGREAAIHLSPALLERLRQDLAMAQGLARKGAMFSAEKAVAQVLAELGRALDAAGPYRDHERCLMAGLRVVSEASDFHRTVPGATSVDWVRLVAGRHQTFVASVRNAEGMDRNSALHEYYAMAIDLLVAGAGSQPIASQAFVSLGKIHAIAESAEDPGFGSFSGAPPVPRSLLFHQVALAVNPSDAIAANELGVSLGRLGFWRESREVLLVSVRSQATPEAWRNLAEAHERLGENSYAQLARREAERMVNREVPDLPGLLAPQEAAAPMPSQMNTQTPRTAGVPFFSGVR